MNTLLRLYASTIARISELVLVSRISRKGPSFPCYENRNDK